MASTSIPMPTATLDGSIKMSETTLVNFDPVAWQSHARSIEIELSDAIKVIGVLVAEVDQATLNVSQIIEQSNTYASGYLNTGTYFEVTGRNFLSTPNLLTARFSGFGDSAYIEGNFPYQANRGSVSKVELSDGSFSYSATGNLQYVFGNTFAASISGTLSTLTVRSPELELSLRGSLEIRSDEIVGGFFSFFDVEYKSLDFSATGRVEYADSLEMSLTNSLPQTASPPTTPPESEPSRYRELIAGDGDQVFQGDPQQIDLVRVGANFAHFTIQKIATTVVMVDNVGANGTDTLVGIERVQFSDKSLAFDTEGPVSAGGIYRLYKATFNRDPDAGGLGYWIAEADAERKDAVRMAEDFVWSEEFQSLYGIRTTDNFGTGTDVEALVRGFYENVLGRSPDQEGLDFYTSVIESKERTVGRVLAEISDSQENYNATISLIANGIVFDPWLG